jgi:uncharacterized protein DUF3301
MNALTFLFALAILVWLWQNSLRLREFAIHKCNTACRTIDLQLLDETVALQKVTIARNSHQQLKLLRRYHFEFSIEGHDRYEGSITFMGQGIDHIQLDHPDGQIILHSDEAKKLH